MIDDKPAVPLSPPTSPHMSDIGVKLDDYRWGVAQGSLLPAATASELAAVQEATAREQVQVLGQKTVATTQNDGQQHRPPLRSHKSFPYSLGPSSRANKATQEGQIESNGMSAFQERVVSQGPQPTGDAALPQPMYGGSAPTSPVGRLTPQSPGRDQNDALMEDDDLDFETAAPEEEEGKRPKTAAELRAQKRKMKRFRLTHNQTRFLMSEFARQAHPDAAHRERLSKEIPGLSPRQVQVWFQNRRAKLKRLTTDDREHMMRSRALPAGFNMTQALHSPFGGATASTPTPSISSQTFAPFGNSTTPTPLSIDTFRRSSHYQPPSQHFVTPTGITPTIGSFAFTPPQSAVDTLSPASAVGHASAFNFSSHDSPRRFSYGVSTGPSPQYSTHAMMPRIHERLARPIGEVVGSPLRSSISYAGLDAGMGSEGYAARSYSVSEQSSAYTHERAQRPRSTTNSGLAGSGPYGLGFSCESTFTIAGSPALTPEADAQSQNYQTASQTQHSSLNKTPATLDAFRRDSIQPTRPASASYTSFATPDYAATQIPQYSYWNNTYGAQPSYATASYQQLPEQHLPREVLSQSVTQQAEPTYTPLGHQGQHHFGGLVGSPQEPGDNSDGGVPVNPAF